MTARLIGIAACAVLLGGCGPVMRDIQFENIRSGIFPWRMDLTFGQGEVDSRELIAQTAYEGVIERPNVDVRYPEGLADLAAQVADAFEKSEVEIRERTGVTWAFRLTVYLVPVTDISGGFRVRISLRGHREMHLPMLFMPGREPSIIPEWSRGLAHEITEASMLASLARRELFLGDYCLWDGGLVNRTRWFRDGVADFAGDIFNGMLFGEGYQPPAGIYRQLGRIREGILDWDNCLAPDDQYAYYDASLALIHEIINRSGQDAIARITQAAFESRYIDGGTLDRAVWDVTGMELEEFLRNYRPTSLGMDVRDTRPGIVPREGNRVVIRRTHPGGPADRWKLGVGDVILTVDGEAVPSAAWFVHRVAAHEPRDRIVLEFERSGESFSHRMMVVAEER